jgi:hypothetical protein
VGKNDQVDAREARRLNVVAQITRDEEQRRVQKRASATRRREEAAMERQRLRAIADGLPAPGPPKQKVETQVKRQLRVAKLEASAGVRNKHGTDRDGGALGRKLMSDDKFAELMRQEMQASRRG